MFNTRKGFDMLFQDVFKEFINTKKSLLKQNTIDLYERIYHLHFSFFKDKDVDSFTPKTIDDWIFQLRLDNKNKQRENFDHELCLLKNIVNFYNEFFDGSIEVFKKRHALKSKLKLKTKKQNKELKESEFLKFSNKLALLYGQEAEMLAILQYYEALRISEAVAIHYNDIHLNYDNPYLSYITINKSVVFTHSSTKKSYLQEGFKNGMLKTLPLMPEVFIYLRNRLEKYKDQFLFIENGIPEFSKIQRMYNRAFQLSDLPYSSTHILRHGGCSRIFNFSGGNVLIASQLLGNSTKETLKTYAHVYQNTLQNFSSSLYDIK